MAPRAEAAPTHPPPPGGAAFFSAAPTLAAASGPRRRARPSWRGGRLAPNRQELFFDGRQTATKNVNPDFVQLADSYGIESFRCETTADLPAAVERFINAKGPVLVDFRVVPDICLPMVAPGKGLDEMFLPGSITLGTEAPKMEGEAPS